MKVERDGVRLSIKLRTELGWDITFIHTSTSECEASHVKASINNREYYLERDRTEYVRYLRNQVNGYKGAIKSMKNRYVKVSA